METLKTKKTEVKVEEGLGRNFNVFIWQNCWKLISDHRFKGHAEEIKQMIEKGASREQVIKHIDGQKIYGRSIFKAPYDLHFNSKLPFRQHLIIFIRSNNAWITGH